MPNVSYPTRTFLPLLTNVTNTALWAPPGSHSWSLEETTSRRGGLLLFPNNFFSLTIIWGLLCGDNFLN